MDMKTILVNATHKEEMRVAILQGSELQDLNIESSHKKQLKGNIYKAVAARVERGLNAVFVDYGEPKHGFLPFKVIARDCCKNTEASSETEVSNRGFVQEGQKLLVQLNRGEIGSKGALLSTYIRIPGRFLVLMPNSTWAGVRITKHASEKHRARIHDIFSDIENELNEGIILRTAGVERSKEELLWDLNNLRSLWREITRLARTQEAPSLIYREGNVVIHTLRDHIGPEVEKIVFDNPTVCEEARRYMESAMPGQVDKIMMHDGDSPLFSSYGIEAKIGTAFEREINLPQGGKIVFDQTEALLSIDINSARSTRGTNIEATALSTNVEAAKEIALQLRLRDVGGLIVIDFIDMASEKDREIVEDVVRRAMRHDRAHNQIGDISSFGLLEMSRQRLRTSLRDSSHLACPRCNGSGWIRTIESNALGVLRSIVHKAMEKHIVSVVAKLPVETISYLLNEKRQEVDAVESQHNISLFLVPDLSLENPNFEINGFRADQPTGAFKSDYVANSNQSAELDHAQHYVVESAQSGVASGEASSRRKPDVKTASGQSASFFQRWFRKLIPSSPKQDEGKGKLPEDRAQYPKGVLTGHKAGEATYKNKERQISDSAGRPIRGRSRTSYGRRGAEFSARHGPGPGVDSPVKTERKHLQHPLSNQHDSHTNQNTGSKHQYPTARYPGTRKKTYQRPRRTAEDDYFSSEVLLPPRDTQTQREAVQTERAPRHESMQSQEPQESMRGDGRHESARPPRQYEAVGSGRQHRTARTPRQREPLRADRQYESARPPRQRESFRTDRQSESARPQRQRESFRADRQSESARPQRQREPLRADRQYEYARPPKQRDPANSESAPQHEPVRAGRSHEPVGMEWQRSLNPQRRHQATRQRRRYGLASSEQYEAVRPETETPSISEENGNSKVRTSSFGNADRQQTNRPVDSFGVVGRTGRATDSTELHTADLSKTRAASPAELRVARLAESRARNSTEPQPGDLSKTKATGPAELRVARLAESKAENSTEPQPGDLSKTRTASPAELHIAGLAESKAENSTEPRAGDPAETKAEPVTENHTQKRSTFVRTVSHHTQIETAEDE